MYNIDFLEQLEKFRKDIFGTGAIDIREASKEASQSYHPPEEIKLLKCEEDVNGEWVPYPCEN